MLPVAETTGGVSPVGWLSNEAVVLIDTALDDYEVIWAAAGHPHAVFPTPFDQIRTLANALPMIIGE